MNRHKLNWTEFPKFQSQNNAIEYYYIIMNEEDANSIPSIGIVYNPHNDYKAK